MNWLSFLTNSKGISHLPNRVLSINQRYGLTAKEYRYALAQFTELLNTFQCSATFPITASVLARHGEAIRQIQEQGIEFAIHGYRHIDYSQLSLEVQRDHLEQARQIFLNEGIQCAGFRGPYLHWNEHTLAAVRASNLTYESSQAILWEVESLFNGREIPQSCERVIRFYQSLYAKTHLSLPRLHDGLVLIPYSLPDDEMLVDRLHMSADQIAEIWLALLEWSYHRSELFCLGLHPERTAHCWIGVEAVLAKARSKSPSVWIGPLYKIAEWWHKLSCSTIEIHDVGQNRFSVLIEAPKEATVLIRSVEVEGEAKPWLDGYWHVDDHKFTVRAQCRPVIGVSPNSSPDLISFLHQQGYVIEISDKTQAYPFYLNRPEFVENDKLPLVKQIEEGTWPLVRLGRWPDRARSALAITGDIDALTLWDYGLRFIGR